MQKQFERRQVGWGFWLRWVLASAIGLAVGGGVLGGVVGGMLGAGAGAGASQWLVLRGKISQAGWWGWWILASAVGVPVGFGGGVLGAVAVRAIVSPVVVRYVVGRGIVRYAVVEAVLEAIGVVVLGGVIMAVVGTLQWLVLRGKISQAGWWILASTVGGGVGVGLGVAVAGIMGEVVGFVVGVIMGMGITGGALVWLLRHHIPDAVGAIETEKRQATPNESIDVYPSPARHPLELTEDERQTLELLDEGLSDEEIADRLGLSTYNVNMMALQLIGKLGVKNKAELIERAREMGFL